MYSLLRVTDPSYAVLQYAKVLMLKRIFFSYAPRTQAHFHSRSVLFQIVEVTKSTKKKHNKERNNERELYENCLQA